MRANEIIAENRAWSNAHRLTIETWISDFHSSRGAEPPTVPTIPPTTNEPTQTPEPSSSTVISLSTFLLGVLIVVNVL